MMTMVDAGSQHRTVVGVMNWQSRGWRFKTCSL